MTAWRWSRFGVGACALAFACSGEDGTAAFYRELDDAQRLPGDPLPTAGGDSVQRPVADEQVRPLVSNQRAPAPDHRAVRAGQPLGLAGQGAQDGSLTDETSSGQSELDGPSNDESTLGALPAVSGACTSLCGGAVASCATPCTEYCEVLVDADCEFENHALAFGCTCGSAVEACVEAAVAASEDCLSQ